MSKRKKESQNNNSIDNSSHDNNNHLFVKLPFLLLNKIAREFDDIIDTICFSLVCKRWFENRNKYLLFNCKDFSSILLKDPNNINSKQFTLNSYMNLFQESINQKSVYKLLIFSPKNPRYDHISEYLQNKDTNADYYQTLDELKRSEIPSNCNWIIMDNCIVIDDDFIDKLERSNVNTLQLLSDQPGSMRISRILPSSIKTIISESPIEQSVLPLELESLNTDAYNQRIDGSLFPRSLKVLKISSYGIRPNNFGMLPPNLEELYCPIVNLKKHLDDGDQLPSTLKIVTISPDSLNFFGVKITSEMIPPNIKYLKLSGSTLFDKNTFSLLQHLETLDLTDLSTIKHQHFGTLPNSLRSLYLPFTFNKSISSSMVLPRMLEFLDLGYSFDYKIKGLSVLKSLKTLALSKDMYSETLKASSIPKSVETLHFKNPLLISPDVIPPTVRSISFTKDLDPMSLAIQIPQTISSINFRFKSTDFKARRLSKESFLLFGVNQNVTGYFCNSIKIKDTQQKINIQF
ncbi:hypothetical protein PPL_08159 [Heterostelium album PN500]|uniref:F-box domain-containing protein n=1 Tax=Heterostelium pallidum (strain ATCC 26659 / Pp 5 / PN500) TaxID=670386 RepID=D3BIS4_HETP5|nr:hypothetical protein PPL_08159 [Heterostelium album PN500]EFA78698.1 hypothetical protein PPL_08159 [Heterostelium album PN500]|eukprot:XP_020430822.1 hypothetical protein PPL_08159 [Heterostelium album PN500]